MSNQNLSKLMAAGAMAVAVSAVAQPADAFVLTNTSASWDNVSLMNGTVVGSDGVAASNSNEVQFLDADGIDQVRWGTAYYGTEVTTTRKAKNWEKRRGKATWGSYTDNWGNQKNGWVMETTETVKTYKNKSGLGFEGVKDLDLGVNQIFNLGTLTHFNQTIYGNNIGTSAELNLNLDFGDSGIGAQNFKFDLMIDETKNSQEVCPYNTDAGKGCSDKITWDFEVNEQNTFTYDDKEYSLELVGFGKELAERGIVTDFISQESGDNDASLFARIIEVDTSEEIPEPGALLGLAGFGLYFAHSRKKAQAEQLA